MIECAARISLSLACLWMGSMVPQIHGQANLRIDIARSNGVPVVSWRVTSLVPAPGMPVFANYQILSSSDLVDWTAGEWLAGTNFPNQTIRRDQSAFGSGTFLKVESVMDFSGRDFIRRTLSKANFEGAILFGCDFFAGALDGSNLRRANLQACDFLRASLEGADLRDADLRGASFADARLTNADLRGANASFSDFTGADLSGVDFAGADLRFTSLLNATTGFIGLHDAIVDEDTLFEPETRLIWDLVNGKKVGGTISNQDLTLSNLRRANLQNTRWVGTDIRGSDLREADLTGANLISARLDFVDFRGTIITDSTTMDSKWRFVWRLNNEDFSNAQIGARDLANASLTEARLAGADLSGANLQLAILISTDLRGANLRNARLSRSVAVEIKLENADLTGADFSSADLTDANLLGATVSGANFSGTVFQNTTMPDGTIRN